MKGERNCWIGYVKLFVWWMKGVVLWAVWDQTNIILFFSFLSWNYGNDKKWGTCDLQVRTKKFLCLLLFFLFLFLFFMFSLFQISIFWSWDLIILIFWPLTIQYFFVVILNLDHVQAWLLFFFWFSNLAKMH